MPDLKVRQICEYIQRPSDSDRLNSNSYSDIESFTKLFLITYRDFAAALVESATKHDKGTVGMLTIIKPIQSKFRCDNATKFMNKLR